MVDPPVVRLGGQVVDELLGEAGADREAVGAQAGQEPVVVTAALAEPPTVEGEGEAGHDNDVERGRVDIAGHHPRSGPSTSGAKASTSFAAHHSNHASVAGSVARPSNSITWARDVSDSRRCAARSAMRRSAPRSGAERAMPIGAGRR